MQELAQKFESYGVSHSGKVRARNEDRFLVQPESGLWLVADGMGGHESGDLAAASIVEHLSRIGVTSSAPELRMQFEDRLNQAHGNIRELSKRKGVTIGSTVAALLAINGSYACLWAGDSRVYLVRNGTIAQVSRDHTEAQDLVERGVLSKREAANWPRRHVITRAIGVDDEVVMEFSQGDALAGDTFVLCTDGLTSHVSDEEIRMAVLDAPPRKACEMLLETVLSRGATDNVTIVVARSQRTGDGETTKGPFFASTDDSGHEF
jgi:serine/threonine protein phosphatase PrpC